MERTKGIDHLRANEIRSSGRKGEHVSQNPGTSEVCC